jgi:hypothetical protein
MERWGIKGKQQVYLLNIFAQFNHLFSNDF